MRRVASLALMLCVMASCALAQVGISADLTYTRTGYSYTRSGLTSNDPSLPVGQALQFSPRVGYRISDFFECGLDLGIANSIYTYTGALFDPNNYQWVVSSVTQRTMMTANAGGYLRFLIHDFGHFSLHVEALSGCLMGWGSSKLTEYDANYNDEVVTHRDLHQRQIYAKVVPVFNYSFRNHFSMDVYMDFASLVYTHNTEIQYGTQCENWGGLTEKKVESETVTDNLDLGIRSLNSSIITLGFGYSF